MIKKPIYLDYAATTPVDPQVAEKIMGCLTLEGVFGNPASNAHTFGWKAKELVENARSEVATLINAKPDEIIWTSGATESDNLAIKGAAHFHQRKGKHIITSKIEHKAVLDTCCHLETEGFEVTYLSPTPKGLIDIEELKAAIRKDTILISIMHINNEIGTILPIQTIGEIAREKEILFHVDAAQSAGKMPIDLKTLPVDLMSFSSHKIYGPKGMGALFVRSQPKVRIEPQIHGGGHEKGLRSGTLPTHQIVGMGEAFRLAKLTLSEEAKRIQQLKNLLWESVQDIEAIQLNGDFSDTYPNILNISFNYIEGESLMLALKDIAVSSGSACTSASLKPSYVLKALGLDDELAHSSIRFSFGRFTTLEEIKYTSELIHEKIGNLREMSPLWDMYKQGIDLNTVEWGE